MTEGFKEAAEKFRMESGIEPSVDLDSLDERIKIREMILKGQIQEAIALINGLHPELLDTNRYLYFHLQVHLGLSQQWHCALGLFFTFPTAFVLQQQHLIELIRLRETEAALEFAQSQLAEQGEESRECLTEMERTLALLAFDNPEESPFGDLLNMMQRQKVWSITRVGLHFDLWGLKRKWKVFCQTSSKEKKKSCYMSKCLNVLRVKCFSFFKNNKLKKKGSVALTKYVFCLTGLE